jgi:hypothetical protein
MFASAAMFSPLEQTVIALAFTTPARCEDDGPKRRVTRLIRGVLGMLGSEQRGWPADRRLDHLHRLAGMIHRGRVDEIALNQAIADGFTEKHLDALRSLSSTTRSRFLTEVQH